MFSDPFDDLPETLKQALIDRFEGWEIVEFLMIPTERVLEAFAEEIDENLDDVTEFAGLRGPAGDDEFADE